jgi:hypothetical protein
LLSAGFVSVERSAIEAVVKGVPSKSQNSKNNVKIKSSDSKNKIQNASEKSSTPQGEAILLIVGGGEEFLHMKPKTLDLVLQKRKGFAKLALTTGCSLVPILTFGENDIFVRLENRFVEILTKATYKMAKFAFPAFVGRWGTLVPNKATLVTISKYQ